MYDPFTVLLLAFSVAAAAWLVAEFRGGRKWIRISAGVLAVSLYGAVGFQLGRFDRHSDLCHLELSQTRKVLQKVVSAVDRVGAQPVLDTLRKTRKNSTARGLNREEAAKALIEELDRLRPEP